MQFAFSLSSIVLLLFIPSQPFLGIVSVVNGQSTTDGGVLGCVANYDPSIDYFGNNKVVPVASKSWSIDYCNTYKVLTNIAANETYLLYQCGTEIPISALDRDYAAIIEIPVKYVGIGVTTVIPQLEQLGVVDSIIAFTSDPSFVSSPCLLSNIAAGEVIVLQSREELQNTTLSTDTTEETLLRLQNAIGFTDDFTEAPPFKESVKISEYTELTNAGIFEWIKFFSAFYNLESKANEVFELTQQRWNCVSEAASLSTSTTVTDDKPPVVFWMVYVAYCGGWDIGSCPNYYCEYAEQCSATLIETDNVGSIYSDVCLSNYLSIEEVVELGKDADYWIYPAPDWNETYTLFKDQLDNMTVVQNQQVYDYQGSGPLAWFETRSAEYFVVLQDFCSVVGTVTTPLQTNRTYFRNVFDGSPIGSIGTECTDESRSNSILPLKGAVCDDLNLPASAPVLAPTPALVTSSFAGPTSPTTVCYAPPTTSTTSSASPVSPTDVNNTSPTTSTTSSATAFGCYAYGVVVALVVASILQ